jgi:hypothetical protein
MAVATTDDTAEDEASGSKSNDAPKDKLPEPPPFRPDPSLIGDMQRPEKPDLQGKRRASGLRRGCVGDEPTPAGQFQKHLATVRCSPLDVASRRSNSVKRSHSSSKRLFQRADGTLMVRELDGRSRIATLIESAEWSASKPSWWRRRRS